MNNELISSDTVTEIIENANDDSIEKDFEIARSNICVVVDTIKTAMESLSEIATQSQHPRAFEVLGKLADSAVFANKSLLDLQEKTKKLTGETNRKSSGKTINNTLIVGSTAELQKILKQMKFDGNE